MKRYETFDHTADGGISVRATLVEEAPEAFKDVSQVVEVVHKGDISKKGAKLRPRAVVKGSHNKKLMRGCGAPEK